VVAAALKGGLEARPTDVAAARADGASALGLRGEAQLDGELAGDVVIEQPHEQAARATAR
jgi:hypothetical protein